MLEIIVFCAAVAIDQLVKAWAVGVLAVSGGFMPAIPGVLSFVYAENDASGVSFLRGRSVTMNIVRVLQLALVLYLLIKQRKKLKAITRVALCLFAAGLVGNQINYILNDFVPDMFVLHFMPRYIFNVADVFVIVAMIILFIRLAFFEGQDLASWIIGLFSKNKGKDCPQELKEPQEQQEPRQTAEQKIQSEPSEPPAQAGGQETDDT